MNYGLLLQLLTEHVLHWLQPLAAGYYLLTANFASNASILLKNP
jgi:hypothetical protein